MAPRPEHRLVGTLASLLPSRLPQPMWQQRRAVASATRFGTRLPVLLLCQGGDAQHLYVPLESHVYVLRILQQQMQQALDDLGILQAHTAQQAARQGDRTSKERGTIINVGKLSLAPQTS